MLGLALALAPAAALAQAKNPEIGTWKLNVEKSKYSPGPAPKGTTLIMEAAGDGVKYTSKSVNAEGKETSAQYTAKYDGKDVPLSGSETADTTSLKRIDANTVERTNKKGGKVVTTARRVYSKDGKSFTVTTDGVNAKGEKLHNVQVFERS